MEARHGFRLPVHEAVERDVANIGKFEPPDGRIVLAFEDGAAVGIACMQRIGPDVAEVKRMYVRPSSRRGGLGRALLERIIDAAASAGYGSIRLDSPDFMGAAHALYRSSGFVDTGPTRKARSPTSTRSTGYSWRKSCDDGLQSGYRRGPRLRRHDRGQVRQIS